MLLLLRSRDLRLWFFLARVLHKAKTPWSPPEFRERFRSWEAKERSITWRPLVASVGCGTGGGKQTVERAQGVEGGGLRGRVAAHLQGAVHCQDLRKRCNPLCLEFALGCMEVTEGDHFNPLGR